MSKMKSFKPLLLLATGFLAASACTLPPPAFTANTSDAGPGGTCISGFTGLTSNANSVDGGTVDSRENNIDNVVTPVSCVGTGANPNAIDIVNAPDSGDEALGGESADSEENQDDNQKTAKKSSPPPSGGGWS